MERESCRGCGEPLAKEAGTGELGGLNSGRFLQ